MSFIANQGFEDSFGMQINDIPKNVISLRSSVQYSPERWRLFKNGNRLFPEYNTVAEYNHTGYYHELIPQAANDTVAMETAQLPNYVTSYEFLVTFSFMINQALGSGEVVRAGLFDSVDGWYMEHNDAHNLNQVDICCLSNGVVTKTISDVALTDALTNFNVYGHRGSWYGVGPHHFDERVGDAVNNSFSVNNIADLLVKNSYSKWNAPQKSNLPVRMEVTLGSSTTGLKLAVGSVSYRLIGQASNIVRTKSKFFIDNIGTIDTWVPIRAFRIDSNFNNITANIGGLQIIDYDAADDVELSLMAFDPGKVTFSSGSWVYPDVWSPYNNAVQTHEDVSGYPDNTGTVNGTNANPGGFQIGYSSFASSGSGNSEFKSSAGNIVINRPVYNRDWVVLLAKSGTTGNVKYQIDFEQEF